MKPTPPPPKGQAAKGGRARSAVLTSEERKNIARTAALARWEGRMADAEQASEQLVQPPKSDNPGIPVALFPGHLEIGVTKLPVYVLDNGKRVITQSEVVPDSLRGLGRLPVVGFLFNSNTTGEADAN